MTENRKLHFVKFRKYIIPMYNIEHWNSLSAYYKKDHLNFHLAMVCSGSAELHGNLIVPLISKKTILEQFKTINK